MNFNIIKNTLGYVTATLGVSMLLPIITAFIMGEDFPMGFVATMLICGIASFICLRKRTVNKDFYAREGFVAVAACWLAMSLFGALPYFFSGSIPSFLDCLYESVSGFTTTGSSILKDIESLPASLLLYRSFSHWIGGMGIIVLLLSILSMAGASSMYLIKPESGSPDNEKLVPKVKKLAKVRYLIYIGLTVLLIIMLNIAGMSFFDSINHAFSIAGTGGFSINNESISVYNSAFIHWIIIVFMVIFSINFNVYHLILLKKFRQALKHEEMQAYLAVILLAIILISANLFDGLDNLGETIRTAAFQVTSVISTTGFYVADYNVWPQFSITILMILMFFGGCASSTAGGTRILRTVILAKAVRRDIRKMLHPKAIECVKLNNKALDEAIVLSVPMFFAMYALVFIVSLLLISIENFDLATSFSAVLASLSNAGAGVGLAGPIENFSFFSPLSKSVLIFDMLAGRLGIFPLLILFFPQVWRRAKNR